MSNNLNVWIASISGAWTPKMTIGKMIKGRELGKRERPKNRHHLSSEPNTSGGFGRSKSSCLSRESNAFTLGEKANLFNR